MNSHQSLKKTYDSSRWNSIRSAYKNWHPNTAPYGYDKVTWARMTPIEENLWLEIRCWGLPFYPQFPVGRYFVDFADPLHKIAIEADGAKWHTDKCRDSERQREIEALGWTVIRITGVESYGNYYDNDGHRMLDSEERPIERVRQMDELANDYSRDGCRGTHTCWLYKEHATMCKKCSGRDSWIESLNL